MRHILFILLLLGASSAFAQDVIVKKDGSTIVCRVVELTSTEITYKKWSDLNGSNYMMNRSEASSISYENGKKIDLSDMNNLYKPGNQSDGEANVNDKALLRIDDAINNGYYVKKARTLKLIGWIGGGILTVSGITLMLVVEEGDSFNSSNKRGIKYGLGGGLTGVGVAWTSCFLLASNHYKSKALALQSTSLLEYDLNLGNGRKLTTGIDLIRDKTSHHSTFGLGLRYNL